MNTRADQQRGCFLGLAVGDALGAAVEFAAPGSFVPVTGYRDGGPHGLKPGEWTDDTSMGLALADSIASVGWNLHDQATRYVAWWRTGKYSVNGRCFDIGNQTRGSLARFQANGDILNASDRSERASGNGSIMRLAPVPIRYVELLSEQPLELARLAAESSLTTHASEQCQSACRYFALILAGLMQGIAREVVLDAQWPPLLTLHQAQPLHQKVWAVAQGSFRQKQPPAIRGSGYVIESLEAALWAFHSAESFSQAVLEAVNLGDDADTTGAVCGQLAGAYWGRAGIPAAWLSGLAQREPLEAAVELVIAAKK